MVKYVRKMVSFTILAFVGILCVPSLRAQLPAPTYSGILEYSIPVLTAVPPVDSSQPLEIASAYLWADQLLRTTRWTSIDKWIVGLALNDTMKFLAKALYAVDDYNPITLYQWGISGWPYAGHPDYPWHYKADLGHERTVLQNRIGAAYGDSARTGFLLACDIISDVTIQDTMVANSASGNDHSVLVTATINDEIKGRRVPGCISMHAKSKGASPTVDAIPQVPPIDTAAPGTCIRFQYSPEWQRGVFEDAPDAADYLSDSTGWWIRPGNEYIVFLYIAGVGGDTSNGYYTVQPFWGVFGTQGAMYRIVNGKVVDPNDDFGLGASAGLTVAEWKTRLRARIFNILNP